MPLQIEDTISSFNSFLECFIEIQEVLLNESKANIDNCLDTYLKYQEKTITNILENNESVISKYIKIEESIKDLNKNTSFAFNILNLFNPSETMHSLLLGYLLNPNESHGQRNLFLCKFLELSGIEKPNEGNWVVTVEKGRIDVLLKRNDPPSVVIIENKSNEAGDQYCQIYRYWLQEMFLPYDTDKTDWDYTLKDKIHFKIIYLSPADYKKLTKISLQKPDGPGWEWLSKYKLPPELPEEDIVTWQFSKEIKIWLEMCLEDKEKLNPENHRLREFIYQYIDYWK
jgi:hypothetical protein